MKTLRHLTAAVAAGALLALSAGAASAETLRLFSGPQGGSWYPLGGAIKNLVENAMPDTQVQVFPGAGIANVKAVELGKADIGFANSVSTVDAIGGKPPFEKPYENVCNVGTLYPQYFQVVANADSGVASIADTRGKALTTQKRGNTGEQITVHLLQAYGLSYDDMASVSQGSYTDSVNLLKDGNADWFTLGTTVPASAIMDLSSARAITMVPIDDDGFAKMQEINPGYQKTIIPAGTYPGQDADVPVIGYATHVIARCDLDNDVVKGLIGAILGGIDDMASIAKAMQGADAKAMAVDIGVPLHPAAEAFYKENGAL